MPYIEEMPEVCELYLRDEATFWRRLWDPNDPLHHSVDCLIIDGAHRCHVSQEKAIIYLRTLWVRPTTSVNELVICSRCVTTHVV